MSVIEGWSLLGRSAAIRSLLTDLERVLPSLGLGRRVPAILLNGETGTGKGLLARTIHQRSPRARGPFVDLNCAAIPATLLESELFGFERGAFTDARQARVGLIESADRGTLFLDEIGLLPEALQAKLLTVLESREVRPLGGTRTRSVDVLIVAATNSDLRASVRERRFREDLYHRLAVLVFSLPPLRERGDDVLELAEVFLVRACADLALPPKRLAADARKAIRGYPWPGNVRELANLIERVALLTEGADIAAADLDLPAVAVAPDLAPAEDPSLKTSVDTFTRARVEEALSAAHGNISAAADRLGVPRSTLRYQLERLGLAPGGDGRSKRRAAIPSRPLAERMRVPAGTDGERKQVSILFASFQGLLDRLAGGDPEVTQKLLDPLVERMIEAVQSHGGTINQVRPNGIMALFGAPLAQEDHAVRACYAALALHDAVAREAEHAPRSLGADVQIRVGLHSGDVVLRSIGGELRLDYAAVPETTHVAARVEQAARPGSTFVTAETFRLAEGFVDVVPAGPTDVSELRAPSAEQSAVPGTVLITTETLGLAEGYVQVALLGPINLKGLAEPVQAYELTGAVAGRSRFQALADRGLTKFVGRASEIEQLSAALGQVRAGRGQVVAVVGEPGVGKSRLFWELTHSHRTESCLIVEAGSVSYGKATSYLPVIDLLRAYFQIESRDDQRKIQEKVTGKLLALDRALEPSLPALLALLDVPVADETWTRLDPPQRRQRTLEGVKRLLLREAHIQPLIVVFEDLHWIDGETQALLDGLVESLPTAQILLLVNYRPEYAHAWSGKTYYRLLRIDPLQPEGAEELLAVLLGTGEELSPLKRLLIDRTQGNPFFLEESVRALKEIGALSGDRGSYRLVNPVQTLKVPATAQAILAARIDRLAPEDKRLLQTASVIGKDVPHSLLRAVVDDGEEALRLGLARLQASEFLYETRLFPDLEYTFKHALTHEVTYGGLLQERRRALHGRLVAAIEALYRDRLDGEIERLAHHALRGALPEKAVPYLQQAGLKAAARSALPDARVWFEQALEVLKALPENQSTLEQAFEIRLELRPALTLLGEARQALECLREAEALAERLNDDRRRGRVGAFLTVAHSQLGELDEALVTGTRALKIARELGDLELRILSATSLEEVHQLRGEYQQVVELATDNLGALPADWIYKNFGFHAPASIFNYHFLIGSLAELGRFAEAAQYAAEAIQLAEPTHHALTVGLALRAASRLYLLQGDWGKARSLIEHLITGARAGNIVLQLPVAVASSAWVLAQLGDAGAALNRLREGEQLVERLGARGVVRHHLSFVDLGRARLLLGHFDEARRWGNRAIESSPGRFGHVAHALHLLGDIVTHPDRFDAESGEAHYGKALALAEPRGMRPLVAHCHLGLGKLYRRTGKREQAREHLTTATTMYRDMGMTYWLEKAEAEMRVLE